MTSAVTGVMGAALLEETTGSGGGAATPLLIPGHMLETTPTVADVLVAITAVQLAAASSHATTVSVVL